MIGSPAAEKAVESCETDRVLHRSVQAETVISSDLLLAFSIDPSARQRLLDGVDDIDMTSRSETEIARFEKMRPAWMPRILPSSEEPLPDDIRKGHCRR